MHAHDPYALHNAFDDLPEYTTTEQPRFHPGVQRSNTLARWKSAASRRRAQHVLGADMTGLRFDDPHTYAQYRSDQRAPYVAELGRRLTALEAAFATHTANDHADRIDRFERMLTDHAAHDDERFDQLEHALAQHASDGHGVPITVLGDAAVDAAVKAKYGGVPVPVAPHLDGKVACWQAGKDLHCTVKVLDDNGQLRCVTGTMPVSACLPDVVHGAMDANVDLDELVGCLPEMTRVVGGEALFRQVCGLLPSVLRPNHTNAYLHGTEVLIALHGGR